MVVEMITRDVKGTGRGAGRHRQRPVSTGTGVCGLRTWNKSGK